MILKPFPNIGRHCGYFGTYSPAGGADFLANAVLLSALTDEGYTYPLSSIVLWKGFENHGLDRYGYIALSGNGNQFTGGKATGQSHSFFMSSNQDFSSTGEVTYTLSAMARTPDGRDRDFVGINLFGGASVLGLWGLDLKKIREENITEFPPYDWKDPADTTTEPVRSYKLMSKKILTDNIFRLENTISTIDSLVLEWVLKFL